MTYGPGPGTPPGGNTGGYFPPPHGGSGGYPPPPGGGGGYPPPPGGGFPPPTGGYGNQEPPASQGSAIAALICNVIALCLCWVLAIPGLILAIIGLATAAGNPKAARMCTLIAWVLFGVGVITGIAYWIFYGAALFATYSGGMY
ncbi:hypothetical protein [Nocardiopsis algeriensis]|uniref:DUF4190 domain-containing protein n=1 Tax=Nocardiopsis algeriensis TaxID=1478215 RepID=A0A841IU28_9ACTN|nr:hypothetical protein [Nocardiopsis algeriensis]MBB6120055.1 hypothetical protein [Nocardiopsis algeriensis]